MALVDSHCHLDFPELEADLPAVLARAANGGVTHVLTIGTRIVRRDAYLRLSEDNPGVLFTVGTHPHGAAEEPDISAEAIVAATNHPRCVGVGESGLDFHYDFAPRDVQERVFRQHIAASRTSGLPLVIHAREADDVMIAILREEHAAGPFGAILHCFSSGARLAEEGARLGFYVSFSGIITFKRSDELRAIAARVPMERLLVETDAPYLAPQSRRGKRNEPAFVGETAAVLAAVKGVSPETIAEITSSNFFTCFHKAQAFRDECLAVP